MDINSVCKDVGDVYNSLICILGMRTCKQIYGRVGEHVGVCKVHSSSSKPMRSQCPSE